MGTICSSGEPESVVPEDGKLNVKNQRPKKEDDGTKKLKVLMLGVCTIPYRHRYIYYS
jgi:hypothetical protein